MIKKYEQQNTGKYSHRFSQIEKATSSKLLLKYFIHKQTNSFLSTNINNKDENNVLSSNMKEPEISDYRKINSNHLNFNHNNIKLTRRSSMMPKLDNSMKKNILGMNLKNYFQIKEKNGTKNDQYLPTIIINDIKEKRGKKGKSFHLKNNKKEFKIKNNDIKERTKSFYIPQVQKFHQSTKNIKNIDIINLNIPKRKIKKMNTSLSIQNKIDCFDGPKNSEVKEKKMEKNHELLYSKQINNYILKIYKTSNDNSNEKTEKKKVVKKKKINKKNLPKFTIKDYLNNFNPKKYIEKLKEKQKTKYIYTENFDEIKNKELDKIYSYIEYFVFKKNNNLKKKKDILEKIKEKNELLISKYKKDFIQIILNEILLKSKMKQKKIIYQLYMKTLIISKKISFHIYIKLSIIRHVIRQSEEDENLYFFNLIKHLLYSTSNKKFPKKSPNIKSCEKYSISPIIQRLTTVKKFVDSNKKKMYYIFFSIKFQYLDCETILKHYDENKVKIIPKKTKTKAKITSIEDNKDGSLLYDSDDFSTIENRIVMRRKSKRPTIYSKYKASSSSKILNINLTKNIINLREPNFESEIQNKNKLILNLNTEKDSNNTNNKYIIELSDSSNSYEFNNYIKSYRTNRLKDNNSAQHNLTSRGFIQDDPQEIILKERRLLFEHFISLVQFNEYDKLFLLLKKSGKFLDLNYRFDNGDTLLHIFVKHCVPQYLIKLLIFYGADIDSQNNYGDTALHIAVKNHKYKTIDLLIKMGASEYIYNNMKKNCWECL